MKTKKAIKAAAALLFNKLGVINVTLRDVAKRLNKSYGNITYHYASKEALLLELFEDMHEELLSLNVTTNTSSNLMKYFLLLPGYNFDITTKYLFLTKDFVEIKRHYPALFAKFQQLNKKRKDKWLSLLIELREAGYLNKHIENADLEYLIILSTSIRSFYFQSLDNNQYNKASFLVYVNQLLKPYLSKKGMKEYIEAKS